MPKGMRRLRRGGPLPRQPISPYIHLESKHNIQRLLPVLQTHITRTPQPDTKPQQTAVPLPAQLTATATGDEDGADTLPVFSSSCNRTWLIARELRDTPSSNCCLIPAKRAARSSNSALLRKTVVVSSTSSPMATSRLLSTATSTAIS